MTRKEEKNDFIANYLEQYNGDSYEASAEREDIGRACQNAIDWADRTMIDKVVELVDSVRMDYYADHVDELIDKIKKLIEFNNKNE